MNDIVQPYDVEAIRRDFPVLSTTVRGKRLAFLDTAASSQRPLPVIEAVNHYERTSHANVHRGVYELSQKATDAFEGARVRVQRFQPPRGDLHARHHGVDQPRRPVLGPQHAAAW